MLPPASAQDPALGTAALTDEPATLALAQALALRLRPRDAVGLSGPLGIGKSVFARAAIRALDTRAGDVPSPTFTLVQLYEVRTGPAAGTPLYHFDLYRLTRAEEVWELGIEDAFAAGIALIEWPDRLGSLAPPHLLHVILAPEADATARRATLRGGGDWRKRLASLPGLRDGDSDG